MMRFIATIAIAGAALAAAVPANAGPVGGYCTDPVSINCTYLDANGRPHNCNYWLLGSCRVEAGP